MGVSGTSAEGGFTSTPRAGAPRCRKRAFPGFPREGSKKRDFAPFWGFSGKSGISGLPGPGGSGGPSRDPGVLAPLRGPTPRPVQGRRDATACRGRGGRRLRIRWYGVERHDTVGSSLVFFVVAAPKLVLDSLYLRLPRQLVPGTRGPRYAPPGDTPGRTPIRGSSPRLGGADYRPSAPPGNRGAPARGVDVKPPRNRGPEEAPGA